MLHLCYGSVIDVCDGQSLSGHDDLCNCSVERQHDGLEHAAFCRIVTYQGEGLVDAEGEGGLGVLLAVGTLDNTCRDGVGVGVGNIDSVVCALLIQEVQKDVPAIHIFDDAAFSYGELGTCSSASDHDALLGKREGHLLIEQQSDEIRS